MSILLLGINHKTASIAIREKVVFSPEEHPIALQQLIALPNMQSVVILSTCNRTEIYCSTSPNFSSVTLTQWLCDFHHLDLLEVSPCLYTHLDQSAVYHLMQVACGLDSMILGEPQILGQLKTAYQSAKDQKTIHSVLDRLFQRTFSCAKQVRHETGIGSNAVSVAFAASSLAKQIFDKLEHSQVMLIGAGETIELVSKHLIEKGCDRLIVANRTLERAQELLFTENSIAITLPEISERISAVDIVITSTASPLPLIGVGLISRIMKQRKYRPLLLIDLAVPRDIEPEVSDLRDVYLYTVDDLQRLVDQNREKREQAAIEARMILKQETVHFFSWLDSLNAVTLIKEYRSQVAQIKSEALVKAISALDSGKDPKQVVEQLANQLSNKYAHAPTQAITLATKQNNMDNLASIQLCLGLDVLDKEISTH